MGFEESLIWKQNTAWAFGAERLFGLILNLLPLSPHAITVTSLMLFFFFFLSCPSGCCARYCRLCCDAEMDHVKYLWTQSWRCKAIKHRTVGGVRGNKERADGGDGFALQPERWFDHRPPAATCVYFHLQSWFTQREAVWFTLMMPSSAVGVNINIILSLICSSGDNDRTQSAQYRDSNRTHHLSFLNLSQVWWAASDLGWVVGHSYICYGPLLHGNSTILYEVGRSSSTVSPCFFVFFSFLDLDCYRSVSALCSTLSLLFFFTQQCLRRVSQKLHYYSI